MRRLGAAAVDMCHVALGIVEAYWEYRLKPWDMAAGVLVILFSLKINFTNFLLNFAVFGCNSDNSSSNSNIAIIIMIVIVLVFWKRKIQY